MDIYCPKCGSGSDAEAVDDPTAGSTDYECGDCGATWSIRGREGS